MCAATSKMITQISQCHNIMFVVQVGDKMSVGPTAWLKSTIPNDIVQVDDETLKQLPFSGFKKRLPLLFSYITIIY